MPCKTAKVATQRVGARSRGDAFKFGSFVIVAALLGASPANSLPPADAARTVAARGQKQALPPFPDALVGDAAAGSRSRSARSASRGVQRRKQEVDDLWAEIDRCSKMGQVARAEEIHGQLLKKDRISSKSKSMLWNTLLKTYATAGDFEGARRVFRERRAAGQKLNSKMWGKLVQAAFTSGQLRVVPKLVRFSDEFFANVPNATSDPGFITRYSVFAAMLLQKKKSKLAVRMALEYLDVFLANEESAALLSAENQEKEFRILIEACVASDRRLISDLKIWNIFERLVLLLPALKLDTAYGTVEKAYVKRGDEKGTEQWRQRTRYFLDPAKRDQRQDGRNQAGAHAVTPTTSTTTTHAITTITQQPALRLVDFDPEFAFRYVRKSRRKANRAPARANLWSLTDTPARTTRKRKRVEDMSSEQKDFGALFAAEREEQKRKEEATVSTEARLQALLAESSPDIRGAQTVLEEAASAGAAVALRFWTSIAASLLAQGDQDALKKLHLCFKEHGPTPTSRDEFHEAMDLAAEAGDVKSSTALFDKMIAHGSEADEPSYALIFKACLNESLAASKKGQGPASPLHVRTLEIFLATMAACQILPQPSTVALIDQVVGEARRNELFRQNGLQN